MRGSSVVMRAVLPVGTWCCGAVRVRVVGWAGVRAWCTRGRRGRGSPGAARARRADGRTPPSPPRTAGGTRAATCCHRAVALAQLACAASGAPPRTVAAYPSAVRRRPGPRPRLRVLAGGLDQRTVPCARARPARCSAKARDRCLAERSAREVAQGARWPGRRSRWTRRVAAVGGDVTAGGAAASAAGPTGTLPNGRRGRRPASASRWRRTAAGVSPSRSARSCALSGPARGSPAQTRSRVRASGGLARGRRGRGRPRRRSLADFHTTIVALFARTSTRASGWSRRPDHVPPAEARSPAAAGAAGAGPPLRATTPPMIDQSRRRRGRAASSSATAAGPSVDGLDPGCRRRRGRPPSSARTARARPPRSSAARAAPPRRRHGPRARPGPGPGRRALRPRVGVMLQDGGLPTGARAGVLAHVAALHAHPRRPAPLLEPARPRARRPDDRPAAVRRAAPAARAGAGRRRAPRAGLPRRADRRPRPAGPARRLGPGRARCARPASPSSSRPTSWTRPSASPTTSSSSTHGRVSPQGTPAELSAAAPTPCASPAAGPGPRPPARRRCPTASPAASRRPGRYVVEGEVAPQLLATVTAWCAAHGVLPEGLALGRRTLEDVFLELTGRELRVTRHRGPTSHAAPGAGAAAAG